MKLELLFEACHLRKDVYTRNDEIMVYLPEGPASMTGFTLRMQNPEGFIYGELTREPNMGIEQPFGFPYQVPEGSYQMQFMPTPVEYYEQNLRITRRRDFYALNNTFSTQPYGSYDTRRIEALTDAARRKNNVFNEIAKMELGWWKNVDERVVLKTIDSINQRADCSDFYLCGLLGVLYRYASKAEFPAGLRQPLEECVVNFKYWHDEPGSDAMCYTTENHSILFHTCEVLAGQLYPERIFTNASQPGRWHIEKGERLALAWLLNRSRTGFKEWDSNTYFEEDTLALSTLASLAENADVWELANLVLDKLFFSMAVNSFKGVFGSTHGRSYTPYIKTGYREGTSGISRLLWGMGIFNERVLGAVSLACSSYELPSILAAIATDQPEALWSKEQIRGEEQDFRNSGSTGSGVNKVTFKTPDYMLCSAQDWHPGEPGYQQHIWQATLSPEATIFTTHPPCAAEDGSHRPNYWHGNVILPRVAQWKDALVAIYNFADDDWMGFTHAYFPTAAMDEYEIHAYWAFGRVGEGYIALAAANGIDFQKRGDNAYRELRSPGTPNIWLGQMGRAAQDGSFKEFVEKVLALPVRFEGLQLEWTTLRGDQIGWSWENPLSVNGERQALDGFKHYDNPYCACELEAPVMEIHFGGRNPAPAFRGAARGGIMSIMIEVQKKGLDKCWLEDSLDPERLHLHITEIPAGARPHPPHTHSGAEAFYILEGSGVIETEGGNIPVTANQAVILDPTKVHGLVNTSNGPMKYIVIIAKP
jgi:mannose-6-phosphate isomerase-like protein (cupin superfamily)